MKANLRESNVPMREMLRIVGGALFILGIWPIVFFVLSGGAINNSAKDLSVAGFLAVVGLIAQIGYMGARKASLKDRSEHKETLLRLLRWAVLGGILVIEIIVNFLRTT
jgi:hypothetical protein